ncbi:hypothetical protein D0866_12800, partial [Hortaea werneckii]
MDPRPPVPPDGLARARDRRRFFSNPLNRIEFAYDDTNLIERLFQSPWLGGKLYGRDYEFPTWLNETSDFNGDPSRISETRLDKIRDDESVAANNNEARYVRNKAFIMYIYEAVKTQNHDVGKHNTTSAEPLGATNVTTPQVTTHSAEGTNANDDDDPVDHAGGMARNPRGRLERLAYLVSQELNQVIPNECAQECGQAPLEIIAQRSDEVLTIAYEQLNTRPFFSVQECWRRLYEDACLFKVVHILRARVASFGEDLSPNERLELQNAPQDGNWLSEIIAVLDKSIQLSGAPRRRQLHNTIFQKLSEVLPAGEMNKYPPAFRIYEPWPLRTRVGVSKADSTIDLVQFQEWLDVITQPLVIPKVTRHWRASKLWRSPRYLMEHTLGGRRLVPIELGKLYTDKDWSQRLMSFAEFTKK